MSMPPPFNMNPPMRMFGPPIEFIIIEVVYFAIISGLSAYIYYKVREIYELTKHKGIFHFKNIFLYFALAYLFRLPHLLSVFSRDLFYGMAISGEFFFIPVPVLIQIVSLFFVSYFSTMAILSVLVSINSRNISIKEKKLNILMHAFALVSTIIVALIRSNDILIIVQTLVFLFAVAASFLNSRKDKKSSFMSHNKITFLLLFLFWILNITTFIRWFFIREIRFPIYLISVGLFLSIFFRVRKRLVIHGKKKRQT